MRFKKTERNKEKVKSEKVKGIGKQLKEVQGSPVFKYDELNSFSLNSHISLRLI